MLNGTSPSAHLQTGRACKLQTKTGPICIKRPSSWPAYRRPAIGSGWRKGQGNAGPSVRPQQPVAHQFITRPQRHPAAIVNSVNRNDGIRIRERQPARLASCHRGMEKRIVQEPFDFWRRQIVP